MTKTGHFLLAVVVCGFLACKQASAQPAITMQPQNQTNIAGTAATFFIVATGVPPLSYQWRSYASATSFTNIPGALDTMLVLTNVQSTSRQFGAVVNDSNGTVTSTLARLVVIVPPSVSIQPTNQVVDVGGAATFTVTATGTAPLSYQWRLNDVALPGKTNSLLILANIQYTNAGGYRVAITNAAGSVTSQAALLTVSPVLHGFSGITALSSSALSLSLTGAVRTLFAPYYDLYPLEASTNLAAWTSLTTLRRTNANPGALIYVDTNTSNLGKQFYRTPSNHLITPLPQPSGPFAVGTFSRLLTDPSRTNSLRGTNHQFMVTVWYPALPMPGRLPVRYVDLALAVHGIYSPYTNRVPAFVAHGIADAILPANAPALPVILYSHGYGGGHRKDNLDKTEDLASHGYVVVGTDHRDTTICVFPNGTLIYGVPQGSFPTNHGFQIGDRAQDMRLIIDELARWNTSDPLLSGRLDLARIGAFGFSYGGAASAELCRLDVRCKAGLNMDGLFYNPVLESNGLTQPFLILSAQAPPTSGDKLRVFDRLTHDAYFLTITNTTHLDFNEYPNLFEATASGRRTALVAQAYVRSFFNKYLRERDDHLLDGPSPSFPEVSAFLRK